MSRRAEQVASVVHREVQRVLNAGLQDPRLDAMTTVTRVVLGDDLVEAVVHVSIVPEGHSSRAIHGLRDAAGYIRREAAKDLRMRRMPRLIFKLDESLKKERAVLEALRDVERENDPSPAAPPDATQNPSTTQE